MKHLRIFQTAQEFDKCKSSLKYPCVSLTIDNNTVNIILPPLYELVDLGLPSGIKWAKCNLGATSPEEFGNYYMWASVIPNTESTCLWKHTPYHQGSVKEKSWEKYNTQESFGTIDNKTVLDKKDDAIYVETYGEYRMPTKEEAEELISNTTHKWGQMNGVNGRIFTSKTNGNNIFIPASGCRSNTSFYYLNDKGYLWTSSLNENKPYNASTLYFSSAGSKIYTDFRYFGFTVRPVGY